MPHNVWIRVEFTGRLEATEAGRVTLGVEEDLQDPAYPAAPLPTQA